MNSFILKITNRAITPIMLIFSIILLFRGHNLPGGGFIGGLTAGAAFVFYAFGKGVKTTLSKIKLMPVHFVALGLLLALLSGLPGLLNGDSFYKGYWLKREFLFFPKIGTPLLFDFGVYLLVMGIVLMIVLPNIVKED